MSEKNVIRKSKIRRECWTWSESYGDAPWREDAEPCTRMIDQGERYLSSTIFPGHDSGMADGGYQRRVKWVGSEITWERVWVPGRPITSSFCLPCARRWSNLRDVILEDEAERSVA